MKTMFKLVVASILLLVQADGCGVIFETPPFPQNVATPTPPVELQVLPRSARIGCIDHPALGPSGVSVWELPGVKPSDPDSAYRGDRGKWLGVVPCRAEVTVTSYAWSETDREFWVYVKASNGLEGWAPIDELDLTP